MTEQTPTTKAADDGSIGRPTLTSISMGPPRIPTTLKLGPITYDVICDAADWNRIDGGDKYGTTNNRQAVIYLNPEQSTSTMRLTLVHEALHAMFSALMGSPTWVIEGEGTFEREERVVLMMEAPLLALIRDNPEMLAYLTAP